MSSSHNVFDDISLRVANNAAFAKTLLGFWRTAGQKIVFTNGCFDLLHPGHVLYLNEARSLGDRLVVGLNDDASVSRLKGPERPVQTLQDRALVLAALRSVDLVVPFSEDTPLQLILELQPDLLVKGGDYRLDQIVGVEEIEAWGGKAKVIPFVAGKSSSALIEKMR